MRNRFISLIIQVLRVVMPIRGLFLVFVSVFLFGLFGCSTGGLKPVESDRKGAFDGGSGVSGRRSPEQRWAILKADPVVLANEEKSDTVSREMKGFRWPLRFISISSPFGKRDLKGSEPRGGEDSDFHEGVDLRAKIGTPVYAAQSGVVIYASSNIRGYGRMVVVRHFGNLATIYAHNSKLLVSRGKRVRRGQLIAYSGNTGHTTGPHLHFEVRHGVTAMNPTAWISTVPVSTKGSLASKRPTQVKMTPHAVALAAAPAVVPAVRRSKMRSRRHRNLRHSRQMRRLNVKGKRSPVVSAKISENVS
jgi:hypothetical protein